MMPRRFALAVTLALSTLAIARTAAAAEGDPAPEKARPAFHLDLETDPTAFVFRGGSLHAGLGYGRARLDLGAYAMDVPRFVESNEGFDGSFRGAGAKLQLFLFDEQKGGFVGVDAGLNHLRAEARDTGRHASQLQVSAGVNAGWRFVLPYGFYATPWIGVSTSFGASDMRVDGKTYTPNPVTVFPAVHLGYRFM